MNVLYGGRYNYMISRIYKYIKYDSYKRYIYRVQMDRGSFSVVGEMYHNTHRHHDPAVVLTQHFATIDSTARNSTLLFFLKAPNERQNVIMVRFYNHIRIERTLDYSKVIFLAVPQRYYFVLYN